MIYQNEYKFWFCPGSVDLYGDEEIRIVTEHSRRIVEELNQSGLVPYEVVLKPTLLTNEMSEEHLMRPMRINIVRV